MLKRFIWVKISVCKKKTTFVAFFYFWWTRRDCIFPLVSLAGPLSPRKIQTSQSLFSSTNGSEPNRQLRCQRDSRQSVPTKNKNDHFRGLFIFGGRAGTRTLDPLIKSQLLYQLSYASKTFLSVSNYIIKSDKIKFL